MRDKNSTATAEFWVDSSLELEGISIVNCAKGSALNSDLLKHNIGHINGRYLIQIKRNKRKMFS